MNFGFGICEYNPLHNGHIRHLAAIKSQSENTVIIMSGNFCQRGEAAIVDKYTRARHAVLAGADIVIELPAVFSVAPAEIFARGAIKLLGGITGKSFLCFGTERGTKQDFLRLAKLSLNESKEFKQALKKELSVGAPYALAKTAALKTIDSEADFSLMESPNSTLGVEYTKAILSYGFNMDIMPIKRNSDFLDSDIKGDNCSALAVREAIKNEKRKKIKNTMPSFVYGDLPNELPDAGNLILFRLLESSSRDLKEITDCSEGLENRFKAISYGCTDYEQLIAKLETRRYTLARLRRIALCNMLSITRDFTEKCLKSNLYLKVLAVAEDKIDLLKTLSRSKNPLLTRKSDADKLSGTAALCFKKDAFCNGVYNLITGKKTNEYEMKIVKRS